MSEHREQTFSVMAQRLFALVATGVVAFATAALVVPAFASAGEVRVQNQDYYKDTGDEGGCARYSQCGLKKVVVYNAPVGERNQVVAASDSSGVVTVTDALQTLTAGIGCTSVNATTVTCATTGGTNGNHSNVNFNTGDLDDTVQLRGTTTGTVDAGPGNDVIQSSDQPSVLVGGGGTDQITGGGGNDVISDGDTDLTANSDTMDGGGGLDELTYIVRTRPVTVNLGATSGAGAAGEDDRIQHFEAAQGGSGNDELTANQHGLPGDSLRSVYLPQLRGNDGADVLKAGNFAANIIGGAGDDRIIGSREKELLEGDDGDDRIQAGAGNDLVDGGRGHDTLDGQNGDDKIYGDSGNDKITGGRGHDAVNTGLGSDVVKLRDRQRDTVSCSRNAKRDRITVDRIDVLRRGCSKASVRR